MTNDTMFNRYNEALRRDERPRDLLDVEDGSQIYQRHVSASQAEILGVPIGERIFLVTRPGQADMTSDGWYRISRVDHGRIRAARANKH